MLLNPTYTNLLANCKVVKPTGEIRLNTRTHTTQTLSYSTGSIGPMGPITY